MIECPFKIGDRVITDDYEKYNEYVKDKILTVKAVELYSDSWFMTFNEVDDSSIGGGLMCKWFTISSNRKSRIESLEL